MDVCRQARSVIVGGCSVEVAGKGVGAAIDFRIVADAIAIGVGRAGPATLAEGVELVSIAIAVSSGNASSTRSHRSRRAHCMRHRRREIPRSCPRRRRYRHHPHRQGNPLRKRQWRLLSNTIRHRRWLQRCSCRQRGWCSHRLPHRRRRHRHRCRQGRTRHTRRGRRAGFHRSRSLQRECRCTRSHRSRRVHCRRHRRRGIPRRRLRRRTHRHHPHRRAVFRRKRQWRLLSNTIRHRRWLQRCSCRQRGWCSHRLPHRRRRHRHRCRQGRILHSRRGRRAGFHRSRSLQREFRCTRSHRSRRAHCRRHRRPGRPRRRLRRRTRRLHPHRTCSSRRTLQECQP